MAARSRSPRPWTVPVVVVVVGLVVALYLYGAAWLGSRGIDIRIAPPNLELQLQPEDIQAGVPQAFKFLLVNTTKHDVTLPQNPEITSADACGDIYYGRIRLTLHFVPPKPLHEGSSIGTCEYKQREWPPVLERVKVWKTLKPGESLVLEASKAQMGYDDRLPGAYEFWANYDTPLGTDDDNTLRQAGINAPSGDIESTHITFIKSAKD